MGETMFPATSMPDRDWWSALWPDPAGVLRALGIGCGMTAVDLCCGDGLFTVALARLTGARVYAVDLDPAMLDAARAEAARAAVDGIVWLRGDARDVATLVPDPVDLVLIANTFHGAPDPTGLARAAAAALRPGGRLIVINWHARPREETVVRGAARGPRSELRLSPEATRAAVEAAGLVADTVVELPPYHYGIVFHRPDRSPP